MAEQYFITTKTNISEIANAIREQTNSSDNLQFPDDFVKKIKEMAQSSTQTLEPVQGHVPSTSGGTTHTGYYAVGHGGSEQIKLRMDAVWSFTTPAYNISSAQFTFEWNNYIANNGGNVGWSNNHTYAFYISSTQPTSNDNDSENSRLASSAPNTNYKKLLDLQGTSGTATVGFGGLNLQANTTYYLCANCNSLTASTLKAFKQGDNTVTLIK